MAPLPSFRLVCPSFSRILALTCCFSLGRAVAADSNTIEWDWATRTAFCPLKLTQSAMLTVTITGINDVLIDFATGDQANTGSGQKHSSQRRARESIRRSGKTSVSDLIWR
jgi:hypothetical protein